MDITSGPWHMSEPMPGSGAHVITNQIGRVIATVSNRADAEFICQAREARRDVIVYTSVDWKAFGAAVAAARKTRKTTQNEAAELCSVSRNYLSQIERGAATDPSYTIVVTLCTWLGLEMPKLSGEPTDGRQ